MTKILFKNGNVFYHGKLQKLDVLIEGKKIIEINENIDVADKVIDLKRQLQQVLILQNMVVILI